MLLQYGFEIFFFFKSISHSFKRKKKIPKEAFNDLHVYTVRNTPSFCVVLSPTPHENTLITTKHLEFDSSYGILIHVSAYRYPNVFDIKPIATVFCSFKSSFWAAMCPFSAAYLCCEPFSILDRSRLLTSLESSTTSFHLCGVSCFQSSHSSLDSPIH